MPEIAEKEHEGAPGGVGDVRVSPLDPPGLGIPMIPLFDDEQLRRLEELQQGAPLLLRRELEMQRPGWMRLEQEREDLQRDDIKKMAAWERI